MKPNIDTIEIKLQKSTTVLTLILADEMVLYVKTRKFFWNISGSSVVELHKLFQDQYTLLGETMNEVAERINQLGANTIGMLQEFSTLTRIQESPEKNPTQNEMIRELMNDHLSVTLEIRRNITESNDKNWDMITVDLMASIMKRHETIAWTLRGYLN